MWGWLSGGAKEGGSDIPAPKSVEEFEKVAADTLKLMLSYEPDDGWNELEEREGFRLLDKIIEGSSSHLAKAKGLMPGTPEKCLAILTDITLENRQKWDENLLFYNIPKQITDSIALTHLAFSAPYPVTSRDFCSLRVIKKEEDGSYYVWGCSVVSDDVPESSEYVRGNAILSGWIFRPAEDGQCLAVHINQLDPKGWIPAFVVNMSKGKAVERLIKIKALLENK